MNTEKILNSIDEYFDKTSPDHVISKLKELGCEFEPCEFESTDDDRINYSHLVFRHQKIVFSKDTSLISTANQEGYVFEKRHSQSVELGFRVDFACFANDETYLKVLNEAA